MFAPAVAVTPADIGDPAAGDLIWCSPQLFGLLTWNSIPPP
jgi:hypothetical protein